MTCCSCAELASAHEAFADDSCHSRDRGRSAEAEALLRAAATAAAETGISRCGLAGGGLAIGKNNEASTKPSLGISIGADDMQKNVICSFGLFETPTPSSFRVRRVYTHGVFHHAPAEKGKSTMLTDCAHVPSRSGLRRGFSSAMSSDGYWGKNLCRCSD